MFLQNQIERISLWGIASKCGCSKRSTRCIEGEGNRLFAKWQDEFHFVASLLQTWTGNLLKIALRK
jgi:hypothetical protein